MNKNTLLAGSLSLLVGLAIGAGGVAWFAGPASLAGQGTQPTNSETSSANSTSPAAQPARAASPFDTIDSQPDTAVNTTSSAEAVSLPVGRMALLNDESHYTEVMGALTHISLADANMLEMIATSMHTTDYTNGSQLLVVRALFQRWSGIDIQGAFDYLRSRNTTATSLWHQDRVLAEGLQVLSKIDPDRMLTWLDQPANDALSSDAQLQIYLGIARTDPELALRTALRNTTSAETKSAVMTILAEWASTEPAAALVWLEQQGSASLRQSHTATILYAWLEQDPQAALAQIEAMPTSRDKPFLLGQYAAFTAEKDPLNAFQWAESLLNPAARQQAMIEVVNQWAMLNPDQLLAHLDSLPDAYQRKQLLALAAPTITYQMTEQNPLKAIAWANKLPGEGRRMVQTMVFQQWFQREPEPAMNWLNQQTGVDDKTSMMASVLPDLPYQDLSLALQMFPTLNSSTQEQMAAAMAFQLSMQGIDAAESWIAALANHAVRTTATAGLIEAAVETDPARALALAEEHAGDNRADVLFSTVAGVSQLDPALVAGWLEVASLTIDEKSELQILLDDQQSYWYHQH